MCKLAHRTIEIVIVDERPMTRWALRLTLEPDSRFAVIGEADGEDTARAVVGARQPDVVVVGGNDGDNLAAVRAVLDASPGSGVLVLRPVDRPDMVSELIAAGARGCLVSKVTPEELVAAIAAIGGDEDRVVLSVPRHCVPGGGRRLDVLSVRELDVLGLVARGLSNAQVGRRLLITEATVKRHLQNAYRKLGAASRLDAVNRACSSGLIEPPRSR
jgi:DNA-binding NarL/FixJ family response regulator